MIANCASSVDDSFGQARRFPGLGDSFGVRLNVHEFEWIDRDHFGVELFKLAVVEE